MDDLFKQVTQLEMMENHDILKNKILKKFKVDFTNFSQILKLPSEEQQDELLEKLIHFWNKDYNKLKNIAEKDLDVCAQIIIYEHTIHPNLQAVINSLPNDRQVKLITKAKQVFDKEIEDKKPKSKEEMKKINDSFLPTHLLKSKKSH